MLALVYRTGMSSEHRCANISIFALSKVSEETTIQLFHAQQYCLYYEVDGDFLGEYTLRNSFPQLLNHSFQELLSLHQTVLVKLKHVEIVHF